VSFRDIGPSLWILGVLSGYLTKVSSYIS
jgi:hypothetical protein